VPRTLAISSEGSLVSFLRSDHGRDPINSLWVYDVNAGVERKVADPRALLADGDNIPAAERARRERMRETTSGITAYTRDDSGRLAAFTLGGSLYLADLTNGTVQTINVTGPVIDPQLSPDGQCIAWSTGEQVRIWSTADGEQVLTPDDGGTWGLADFVAAEELDRVHGLWWSPQSDALLVERFDDSMVESIWLADPATPEVEPRRHRYPFAGTTNATVTLHLVTTAGQVSEIPLGTAEYLVSVRWKDGDPLVVQASRDQRHFTTSALRGGTLQQISELTDPNFLDVIPGQPRWWNGQLLEVVDDLATDTRRLVLDGKPITPTGMQVLAVLGTTGHSVDVVATRNATDRFVASVNHNGEVTVFTDDGVWAGSAPVEQVSQVYRVRHGSRHRGGHRAVELWRDDDLVHVFDSHAERPALGDCDVHTIVTGKHSVKTAVLFPTGHLPGSQALPVLMRPYGGPHGAQVLNAALAYVEDQWFADQGFAVVVADGRGTPGRGPRWEREVAGDFADVVLADQIAALYDAATAFPGDLDLTRVGIMGWSFGGYLAALAVLDRPDVFHAAVAGAPVTEWRWYDTAYTERYLGHPETAPEAYHRNSLLHRAAHLQRPLMLVHGLADDNVLARHTLALSGELLAHRKPHTVLPLSGVTHMTPQEVVAENLMLLSVDFLRQHLGG
jgi:dipeptidyl-peptidase-4